MRNTKKYIGKLFDAGYTLRDGGVYWLNGDAGLKASERQKFRKILGWLENLPKILEDKFNLKYNIVIGSNFYENGNEEWFEIYGFDRDTEQDVFYFGEVVNDLDKNDYIHHWEGFKKLLKLININNLDHYLADYFKKIEIIIDKDGDYNVSHTESIYGVQGLIDLLYDEEKFNPEKLWEFKDRIYYAGYRTYIGCYHATSNKDIFFWESASSRLLALEVIYREDTTNVINYNWSELYEVKGEGPDDENESWIYKYEWESREIKYTPITKYSFN